jgi:hypothetical protein|tara:strand:+ start:6752 stop:7066 length:315 start_codon:yes stop_codon:yes gene_type:complete
MANPNANYYGILLLVLAFVTVIGLFTGEPTITGLAVQEVQTDSFFDVKIIENDPRTCADGSLNGECSSIIKPKFCLYGTLVDYCELCGCDAGEECVHRECVKVE